MSGGKSATDLQVERLSPAQKAGLASLHDEWLAVGLSCEPTDREIAELGVELAYETVRLKPPTRVEWAASPAAARMLARQHGADSDKDVAVRYRVRGDLRARLEKRVKEQVFSTVWTEVDRTLNGRLRSTLDQQGRTPVIGLAGTGIALGQMDASWLATYSFYERFCGVGECRRLEGQALVARSAGVWWALENAVVMSDRPVTRRLDGQGHLHSQAGPALEWADGEGVFALEGIMVPRLLVEHPESVTLNMIEGERNIEVRRLMMRAYGFENYLGATDAQMVGADEVGKLWRLWLPDEGQVQVAEVLNSHPEPDGSVRRYFLRVSAFARSTLEGIAGTFGLTAAQYADRRES